MLHFIKRKSRLKYLTFLLGVFQFNSLISQSDNFLATRQTDLRAYKQSLINDKKFTTGFSFGTNIELGWKRNGSLSFFATIAFLQNVTNDVFPILIGGKSELEIYRGGLGTSVINGEKSKFNIELRNSVQSTVGQPYTKHNKVFTKPAFASIANNRSPLHNPFGNFSFSLGTTFINGLNHSRNQQVGDLSLSIGLFQFQYVNDATPLDWVGLGDRYDRYWTGCGGIGFYPTETGSLTEIEIRYDNYTGYQPNAYETSTLLQLDNISYKDPLQQMFNQSRLRFSATLNNTIELNYSIYQPKWWDIQYFIHHNISNDTFHDRPQERRYTVGAKYINRRTL